MKVLVVGGRSGIGRMIAHHLANRGAAVVAASRRAHAGLSERDVIGEVDLDATDSTAVAACLASVAPDHVVVTMTDVVRRPIDTLSEAECRRSFETKFWGQFHVARAAMTALPSGGSVVLFSGLSAQAHFPALGIAGVVNAAVERLTLELAAAGPVRVNCVSPGVVVMPPGEGGHGRSPEFIAALAAALPARQPVTAQDVAALVHHLIVNPGANGTIARIDAGHLARSGLAI